MIVYYSYKDLLGNEVRQPLIVNGRTVDVVTIEEFYNTAKSDIKNKLHRSP